MSGDGIKDNSYQITNAEGLLAVQTCVAVGFKLLNTSLVGTYESHEDGSKELLIQPSVNYVAEPFGIADLIGGINDFFKGVCGKEQLQEDYFKAGLEQFLKDLNLDSIGISLQQVFVHVTKPKSGDAKVEYAFSLKLENVGSAAPKDFTFASLDSIAFGIWNTDNKRILAGMGLLSIAEQLGN